MDLLEEVMSYNAVTEKHFLLGGTAEIACRACRPNSSASVEK
jgi:hypothetical protein